MMKNQPVRGNILVVDDTVEIRELLHSRLEQQGHNVIEAKNGREALNLMRNVDLDLVLLDIMMPEMNGYQVLEEVRESPELHHIPIIVISAIDDIDSVVRCIELGATDYLPKPFKASILRARVESSLEKKRLRDNERSFIKIIDEERARVQQLLLNILPYPIAERLKSGETPIADMVPDVSIMFSDLVNFTPYAASVTPAEVVTTLDKIFTVFDNLVEKHGLEKVKTSGDAYIVAGGLTRQVADHPGRMADLALEMRDVLLEKAKDEELPFTIRFGIHLGPVVAGVIGKKKISFDVWGDTVNIASRMESQGVAGYIQVSQAIYDRLSERYDFEPRGAIDIKGKGQMQGYLLLRRR